jgi:hypothetical protein
MSASTHYKHFVDSLTINQANALRVLLSFQDAPKHLRAALNVKNTVSIEDHRTGCARRGDTIRLFPEHMQKPVMVDLNPGSRSITVSDTTEML